MRGGGGGRRHPPTRRRTSEVLPPGPLTGAWLKLYACSYEYLVLDDCWAERERPADGKLVGHKGRFPSGMKVGGLLLGAGCWVLGAGRAEAPQQSAYQHTGCNPADASTSTHAPVSFSCLVLNCRCRDPPTSHQHTHQPQHPNQQHPPPQPPPARPPSSFFPHRRPWGSTSTARA